MRLPFASSSFAASRLALLAALAPLATVLSLAAACYCGTAAVPAARAVPAAPPRGAPAPPLCRAMHDLALPLFQTSELALTEANGNLVVDGTVTSASWTVHAPLAYTLADGRVLLHDAYYSARDALYLWDPPTRTLTSLGRGDLARVAGVGYLVRSYPYPSSGDIVYSDIDPHAPRLRELYRGTPGDTSSDLIGTLDGAIAIFERPRATADAGKASIACLSGPGEITRIAFDVPRPMHVPTDDAIRGHRLLLIGEFTDRVRDDWAQTRFSVPVDIIDLDTRTRRRIGSARGAYTAFTNMPHPYVQVAWSDDHDIQQTEDTPITRVDVATESLRAVRQRP